MLDTTQLYLVIDQGGHASRAVVFNTDREIVGMHSMEIETLRHDSERVEHDAEALIKSILEVIEDVSIDLGTNTKYVVSAGLATQRSSIVCWDRHSGDALSPVLSWQDRRTSASIEQYSAQADMIHKLTGLMLSPHYGATKLKWCLENIPAVKQAYSEGRLACGPLSSFIIFRVINEHPLVLDPANASRTLLWNYRSQNWDVKLLSLFCIPVEILPQCVPNQYDYGHISVGPRKEPLSVVSGDQSAALYALGQPMLDTTYINIGTGAFLQRPIGSQSIDADRLLSSLVWQTSHESAFVLEGTVNGAGSALTAFAVEQGLSEDDVIDLIERGLSTITDPPLFFNGVSGLGSPFWIADYPSHFSEEGSQLEKLVAVIESIVFLIVANLEEMTSMAGRAELLVVTGGLSAVDGLCQKLADLSGTIIERPQMEEATAHGMAYLISDIAGKNIPVRSFKPEPDQAIRHRYQRWLGEIRKSYNG